MAVRVPTNPATAEVAAAEFDVAVRTLSNWAAAGHITRFRVRGQRGLVYDLDEITREAARNPAMRLHTKAAGTVVEVSVPIRVRTPPRRVPAES
jgi:hypothetical protein